MLVKSLLKLRRTAANEQGIALVTALMLTLMSLAIVMALMYVMTLGTQRAGATKRYKTALEASYGGSQVVVKDMIPYIMRNYSSPQLATGFATDYSGVSASLVTTQKCIQAKLTKATKDWPAGCSATLLPKSLPDLQMTLMGTNNTPFTVYSKIVDTVAGNSDTSGFQLEGAGVAESTSVITPQHIPYMYRVEIQAERATRAVEKSNISVLYAY
jgi:hypothetical protein